MERLMYFAYGSNLDARQMRLRCPTAEVEARAALPNYALAFGGFSSRWCGAVATVVRARDERVDGLLYSLPRSELRDLDRHEGCPSMYQRRSIMVTDEDGRRRRAQVYQQPDDGFVPWLPQRGYLGVLRRAYKRLGFDLGRLAAAVEVVR